jgi:PGF-pre-PGF domain-containing protein/PGF-CTERM protein
MRVRGASVVAVVAVVGVALAGAVPAAPTLGAAAQGGDGPGGGPGPGGDGHRPGGPNVSVGPGPGGGHAVMARNVSAGQTVRVRFRERDAPDVGVRLREMTMTADRGGDYQFTVRTAANASAGVRRFAGPAPFGYVNVTHAFPNANVANASLTFTLERARLRERDVAAENVSLYRYRTESQTWSRLQTRVVERNATHATFRAASPGLSEFAVAPTVEAATETPTATPTGTPTAAPSETPTTTSTQTPTEGDGAGFGPALALLALLSVGLGARRE